MARQRKSSWKEKPHPTALTEENIEAHYRGEKKAMRSKMLMPVGLGVIIIIFLMVSEPQLDASDIEAKEIRPTRVELIPEYHGTRSYHEAEIELYVREKYWVIGDRIVPRRYRIEDLHGQLEHAEKVRIWAERGEPTIVGLSASGVEIPAVEGMRAVNAHRRWLPLSVAILGVVVLAPIYFWPDMERARKRRKIARMLRKKP